MQDLNDLHYFAKVVEAGGFAAAGRLLGIPKSRLSRRIAELEARLAVRLLQRTTRKLALTEVGERYYRHCQAMLVEAEAADEVVAAVSAIPRGRLRVSCPVALAQSDLSAIVVDFLAAYPEVMLELVLTNRRVDLVEEGLDVALRVRSPDDEDPSLISRRLRPAAAILVASPSLLQQHAITVPEDLHGVPILGAVEADRRVRLRLEGAAGVVKELAFEPRLSVEDFELRKAATLRGLGVGTLPHPYCTAELASGELVQVLPDWEIPGGFLQAVYPHRRGLLPAVRVFIDFLVEVFGRDAQRLV
ncbi:LysR substrate-binding domain-containing protein [Chitinimonas viridis]|uniref:LysR substrate-binding domain-containing protein n=1 Tax=Chitinimonas viridis TaxID=664880 RepID=A0ABT8B573_9NEIS|nr:LysR substrate-binding domain-containing protein [Chitinimonas viridis]MDN3577281.1 LysR substrate-binding domain-containing protein [Chitinimonas viridis]